jgi:RimJ/RimL family protein N-acetyltransferase
MGEFRLETERLVLREWREADRHHFWQMTSDAEMMRYLLPLTREASDAAIDRQLAWQAGHGHCMWVAERKSDGRAIGYCGILPPRAPMFEYELGWRLESAAWGQGFAREAAQATLAWTWANLDTTMVVAITHPENERSWGLMIRLGMTRNPAEDFDHPDVAEGDPLRHCVLYRISRPR